MNKGLFQKEYKRLNSQQKRAVDLIEGPTLVTAGPGTGKTQVLTLRIAQILNKTQINPENILALTFTEAAATNMRRRLLTIIGQSAYRPTIATFHGFASGVIQNYPDYFPEIIGAEPITETQQFGYFEAIIKGLDLEILRPIGRPDFYIGSIRHAIDQLKREDVTPEKFEKIVDKEKIDFKNIDDLTHEFGPYRGKIKGKYLQLERQINKNAELLRIYRKYQQELRANNQYDFGDMIIEVVRALEQNPNLKLELQERYQYVLVDEYQDSNQSQSNLVHLLMDFHENPNLFVVGDEKQSIYRFQGASLKNFRDFKSRYPTVETISLHQNYRSTQEILNVAQSLLSQEHNLKSAFAHSGPPATIFSFPSIQAENNFLVDQIKAQIKSGRKPEEIAILYRDNSDSAEIAQTLERQEIPFVIESSQDVLADIDISKIVLILEAINDFGNDQKLIPVLHIDFLKFKPEEVFNLVRIARESRKSLWQLLKKEESFSEFYKKMISWAVRAKNEPAVRVLGDIFEESNFNRHLYHHRQMAGKISKAEKLFDEVRKLNGLNPKAQLADFLEHLRIIQTHQVAINKTQLNSGGAVRLMTAHRAKGLEFESVFIIGATDGHWGNRRRAENLPILPGVFSLRAKDLGDENGDDRRLFYVALTRARKAVIISYSRVGIDGQEQLPSQFISELDPRMIKVGDGSKFEKPLGPSLGGKSEKTVKKSLGGLVRGLLEKQGLSVTALNNYLKCPWQYFYVNLLRVPQAPAVHQYFGIAVHTALGEIFKGKPNRKRLLTKFKKELAGLPLTEIELRELQARGERALGGWFDRVDQWPKAVKTEYRIDDVLLGKEIRLVGVLDRLELLPKNEVKVIDYKTGNPKSRNDIMGKTKASDGSLRRQLVFYKLLLDHHRGGQYLFNSATIDFVEPNSSGNYKKEEFFIEKSEVAELKGVILKAVQEIKNLSFWEGRCEDKACQFCRWQNL
ncbi:MAG: hypothetical protein COV31_00360 [Candidatus Yanofskybacteria bacterium CG10_big_fil_rev_8_21_14_0_10_46_23]|uniref:DNA 3'-5' helicase n=1 Tax=Candidatus Yanofskybacteria bacterium CG10_big_fil_rev_8_21_14_0_10_46_23 TaxID=1975098 RepID=A0A2H0R4U7_9BACT|nr:MAG: hypothetical protein COV31_00360 [Candidatus Yanofskybacteria bacterium CG10_big_fil_rev_8_21_14_0_10_46_23]